MLPGHDQDSPRCRRVLLICPEWITLVPEHLSSLPWPGCSVLFLNVFPFETSEVERVTRQHHLVERAPAWDPRHPRAPPFPYGLVFLSYKMRLMHHHTPPRYYVSEIDAIDLEGCLTSQRKVKGEAGHVSFEGSHAQYSHCPEAG